LTDYAFTYLLNHILMSDSEGGDWRPVEQHWRTDRLIRHRTFIRVLQPERLDCAHESDKMLDLSSSSPS